SQRLAGEVWLDIDPDIGLGCHGFCAWSPNGLERHRRLGSAAAFTGQPLEHDLYRGIAVALVLAAHYVVGRLCAERGPPYSCRHCIFTVKATNPDMDRYSG